MKKGLKNKTNRNAQRKKHSVKEWCKIVNNNLEEVGMFK